MSLILNIDTSGAEAVVSLAENGITIQVLGNSNQKDHAGFLHTGIKNIFDLAEKQLHDLDAIAVTSGPGSYTGLRVGMASAKGLCYALNKPFIAVGTLDMMAKAAIDNTPANEDQLFCPLIDARRMEVFTGIYFSTMKTLTAPGAIILDENTFQETLRNNKICFFGSGSDKFQSICTSKNAFFMKLKGTGEALCKLSYTRFLSGEFTDLITSGPLYVKDFQSSTPVPPGN